MKSQHGLWSGFSKYDFCKSSIYGARHVHWIFYGLALVIWKNFSWMRVVACNEVQIVFGYDCSCFYYVLEKFSCMPCCKHV